MGFVITDASQRLIRVGNNRSAFIGTDRLYPFAHGCYLPGIGDYHLLGFVAPQILKFPEHLIRGPQIERSLIVGVLESFVGGLIVLPISLIFMGHAISIDLSPERLPPLVLVILLTAFASAAMGLLVGTLLNPSQIAAMFPGFPLPVVFLGSIFYTWHQLAPLPVMQAITLIDPLTWINEAIRAVMTPQIYSLPLWGTLLGMVIWILFMGRVAFKRFDRMVYRH